MSADQLPMWIFSIGTAMTVVAGLLATRIGREWLGTLAPDASEDEGADWSVEAPSPEPGR